MKCMTIFWKRKVRKQYDVKDHIENYLKTDYYPNVLHEIIPLGKDGLRVLLWMWPSNVRHFLDVDVDEFVSNPEYWEQIKEKIDYARNALDEQYKKQYGGKR